MLAKSGSRCDCARGETCSSPFPHMSLHMSQWLHSFVRLIDHVRSTSRGEKCGGTRSIGRKSTKSSVHVTCVWPHFPWCFLLLIGSLHALIGWLHIRLSSGRGKSWEWLGESIRRVTRAVGSLSKTTTFIGGVSMLSLCIGELSRMISPSTLARHFGSTQWAHHSEVWRCRVFREKDI